jgi:hypothetical protein
MHGSNFWKIWNRVVLCWIIYFVTLPFLSPYLGKQFPDIWTCQYQRIAGRPCPFCGITASIGQIFQGEFDDLENKSSLVVIIIAAANVIIRLPAAFVPIIPSSRLWFLCLFELINLIGIISFVWHEVGQII